MKWSESNYALNSGICCWSILARQLDYKEWQKSSLDTDAILASELDAHKGHLVAVAFSGKEAFKRIGECVPGQPRLRLFEAIGGLGSSILVRSEAIDDDPFESVPLFETAYKIVGVIYDND